MAHVDDEPGVPAWTQESFWNSRSSVIQNRKFYRLLLSFPNPYWIADLITEEHSSNVVPKKNFVQ